VGLQVYRKKRKFDVTAEPRGRQLRAKGNRFVIQKHDASRLHYDFRLELDGVMKSWAVTRGPSLNPADKRLAVQTEDHPIEYNSFEGTIPKGQYGGGTVMIWDRGTWIPESDPHKAYAKGHLAFELDGEKLHGRWHLVRMRGRGKETKDPWLLIKSDDEWARGAKGADILEEEPRSVVSGRSIPEIADGKGRKRVWQSNRSVKANVEAGATKGAAATAPRESARGARRSTQARKAKRKNSKSSKSKKSGDARLPDFVPPSLATLRDTAPNDPAWVHEVKFDGYRIQARLDHGKVRLLTRKGLDWADKFPNVVAAVAALPAETALLDGEIIVEDEHGVSSFSRLQADLRDDRSDRFVYYVFDLLHRDGEALSGLPLVDRKAALQELVGPKGLGPIKYSEHFSDDGAVMLRHACELGLEGIVSKLKDALYRSGRSETFLKIKCANAQELVVGGYSSSNVMPRAVGALVVGYYEGDRLHYAGRVGTGYTQTVAKDLWKRLHPLETDKPPFDDIPREERRAARWVKPLTVIEANLSGGWTADGLVRQAAFKGVREDKPAKEVVREMPAKTAKASKAKRTASKSRPTEAKTTRTPAKPASDGEVRFTHPERVYWEDVGVTKRDLADYYRAAWAWMAPYVMNRPLAFLRCPDGTKGQCFFQKHASAGLTEQNLRTVIDKNRRQIIAIESLDGLLSLVQAGVLEIHVRGSMIDRLDQCDRIVFDLDPGEGVAWSAMVAAARDVRDRLAGIKLESFVKLSGGKGLHVVLPIEGTDWDTAKTFAQAVAMAMAADDPDRYVAKMTKSLRGGKIFVDYFRNSLEQTSVGAYSSRARAGAPISAPVTWEELGRTKGANQYTVLNAAKRLASLKNDPWQDMNRVKQRLPDLGQPRKRR
jgi:bifunctional non-homologous end joining protein LigD